MTSKEYRITCRMAKQAADVACMNMEKAYANYSMEELNQAYTEAMERINKAMAPFEAEFQLIAKSEVSKCYIELANELESLYADGLI